MPTPAVTGFTAKAHLKGGLDGLNKVNNSTSPTNVTGKNLVDQMPVNVVFGSITWSGQLNINDGSANLKCSNPGGGIGDPEDVTVTVGSGSDTSPPVDFPVNVGTP